MRTYVRLAAAWLVSAGLAAFAGNGTPEKFAGTWEARAKGTVFLVLKISAGDKISGSMMAGRLHLDEKGDILDAGPPEHGESPIFFAQVDGDKLTFNFQDDDED